MSEIDRAAAIAIGRLEDGDGLDKDSFASFTLFAALQHQRLPSMDRDTRLMYEQALEEMMRVAFSNPERARMMMDRYLEESDKDPMVTPESMVEAVRGKHVRAHATETAFLENMMHMAVSWVSWTDLTLSENLIDETSVKVAAPYVPHLLL
jgi:hypothetical protein